MDRLILDDALKNRDAVLRAFLDQDGALTAIPTKIAKRLVVLDLLAQQFDPGVHYSEAEVNAVLRAYHPDVAALRRYLVEEGFLDRRAGSAPEYWRRGGSVEV